MNPTRLHEVADQLRAQNALEQLDSNRGEAMSVIVRYVPKIENVAYGERANLLRTAFNHTLGQLVRHNAAEFDVEDNLSVSDQTLKCKLAVDGIMLLPIFMDEREFDVTPVSKLDEPTP